MEHNQTESILGMNEVCTQEQQDLSIPSPTALVFERQVNLKFEPVCVHRYKGVTYVGFDHGVTKVHDDRAVPEELPHDLSLSGVIGLCIYKDEIFVLGNDMSHYKVVVYDVNGKSRREWTTCVCLTNHGMFKICAVNGKLIIPNQKENLLIVYSTTGELIKSIQCDLGDGDQVNLTSIGDNSVLVTVCFNPGIIFRINIDTHEIMWKRPAPTKFPSSTAALYKENYLLVCVDNSKAVHITVLDIHTGEYLGDLKMSDECENMVLHFEGDLATYNDTLIVSQLGDLMECDTNPNTLLRPRLVFFKVI